MTILLLIFGGIPLVALVWLVWEVIHYPVEEVHPYNWEDDGL